MFVKMRTAALTFGIVLAPFYGAFCKDEFSPRSRVIHLRLGGSPSSLERTLISDIQNNKGRGPFLETLKREIAAAAAEGRSLTLVAENETYDFAFYTAVVHKKLTGYSFPTLVFTRNLNESLDPNARECLTRGFSTHDRMKCYETYFVKRITETYVAFGDDLAGGVYTCFGAKLSFMEGRDPYIENAIERFQVDMSPIHTSLIDGRGYEPRLVALAAYGVRFDLNAPGHYGKTLAEDSKEVAEGRKYFQAFVALKNAGLHFASSNLKCTTGRQSELDNTSLYAYKDASKFVGPVLLTSKERSTMAHEVFCRHYYNKFLLSELFETMERFGFMYRDGVWSK